ncbi:MAG: hypothetical protein JRF33_22225 [Deltaproteobacteria bacterium]|nr:hypothetical protein [Deltaproteobacteria bacterium]
MKSIRLGLLEALFCRASYAAAYCAVLGIVGLSLLACAQSVDEGALDGSVNLEIRYQGESRQVNLGELAPEPLGEDLLVPLSDAVASAWPELMPEDLLADFAAGDGFRPASRSNCVDLIPLAGTLLEQGFVHALTGNLSWDEALDFPGCLQMSDLASVFLSDADTQGRFLRFVLEEQVLDLDLSYQPTVDVEGQALVSLSAVVEASGISESPELYLYDFEGADGFRPTVDREEEALGLDLLAKGWIHPESGDLSWAADLDLDGDWSVGDCVAVHLLPMPQAYASVTVVHGADEVTVDLSQVASEVVDGEELVPLDSIVSVAGLVEDSSIFVYDFEGADGFRPTVDREAEALPFEALGSGWMHPVSRNLSWDASLSLSGWWSVGDTARIHLLDQ